MMAAQLGPGAELTRTGDEIIACGRLFHTGGARVVTFLDERGYDGYSTARRFPENDDPGPPNSSVDSKPAPLKPSFSQREVGGVPHGPEGWTLPELQGVVDQVVVHFDACGSSRRCFEVLHDLRGLSCHFLLDVDGTIYQTLDLREKGWHATVANSRSVGIEIANIGAQGWRSNDVDLEVDDKVFSTWFTKLGVDRGRLSVPPSEAASVIDLDLANKQEVRLVHGACQGQDLVQYLLRRSQLQYKCAMHVL
jgi:N-acetylmuramoyl-L-alanine amidase